MPHLKPTDFDVTKHSDYFVWKDTSERVARRCDDTVDKKRVNSCVLKNLFWREMSNQKYHQTKPGNALADTLLMSRFQNFAADAAKKNHEVSWNRASRGLINEWIRGQRLWEVVFSTEWIGISFSVAIHHSSTTSSWESSWADCLATAPYTREFMTESPVLGRVCEQFAHLEQNSLRNNVFLEAPSH